MRLTLAIALLLGCGAPAPSRHPAPLIPRVLFDGEWWYVASVESVDGELGDGTDITAPWPGALIHSDARTDLPVLARIRWQVSEEALTGVRVGESAGPVVAFPIVAHLDDMGRPTERWSDGTQIRVDWSAQLIVSPGLFGPGLATDPSSTQWRREPIHTFLDGERPRARGAEDYLEHSSTEQWTVSPTSTESPVDDLQVRLQHRFWRIPEDHAFVGVELSDEARDAFPTFRTESGMRFRRPVGAEVLGWIPCEHDAQCASSRCDRERHVCRSRPEDRSPIRFVLSAGYPAHLRRGAFEAVAQWNEAFMRARRVMRGEALPNPDPLVACQPDPTRWCFTSGDVHAPEVNSFEYCDARRDWFIHPDLETGRDEYECWIEGPAEPERPRTVEGYHDADTYAFRGEECALVLELNPCDLDGRQACVVAGDPRQSILHYAETLGTCGVAQPRMDPTTGEGVGGALHVGGGCLRELASEAVAIEERLRPNADIVESPGRFEGYERWLQESLRGDDMIPATTEFGGRSRTETGPRPTPSDALATLAGTPLETIFEPLAFDVFSRLSRDDPIRYGPPRPANFDLDEALDRTSTFRNGPLDLAREADRRQRLLAAHLVFGPRWAHFAAGGDHAYWSRAIIGPDASLLWEQMLHRAMVARLIGHGLGLIPNLAASRDEAHYAQGYRDLPLPEPEERTRTEADLARRRYRRALRQRSWHGLDHLSSSSVLDLQGDLSDLSGVGPYDQAAILASYFDLRERLERGGYALLHSGGETCSVDTDCPYGPDRAPIPEGQDPQTCLAEQCTPVTYDQALEDYAVCYPMQIGRTNCLPQDAGSSLLEVVHHYRDRWLDLYPRTHGYTPRVGLPSVAPSAVAALMRLSTARVGYARPNDADFARQEGFAWLVELLTRPPHGYFSARAEVSGDAVVGVGLTYERLLALNALTARTFDGRQQQSYFDRFEHSRAPVLHALMTGHAARFAPRPFARWGSEGSTAHLLYPDPRVITNYRYWPRIATSSPRIDEVYGPPIDDGYLGWIYRALAAVHAYAESPAFDDGPRRAWAWRLGPDEAWTFPGEVPCAYGQALPATDDPSCTADEADYAVYRSDASGELYAASAVTVGPTGPSIEALPEPGYELLVDLIDLQSAERTSEITESERVLEALIETQRQLGANTWLPPET